MRVVECNQTTYFDVDDTLIMWNPTEEQIAKYGMVYVSPDMLETTLVPHLPNIDQLRKHKLRGHTIIVWSAGGYQWAAEAIKFLQLEEYVDLVISKPTWFYDDKDAEEFMGKRQYMELQR